MAKLTDFSVLTFDCFGTIVDWEKGALTGLEAFISAHTSTSFTRERLLEVYHECEAAQQSQTPDLPYDQLVARILPQIAAKLGSLPEPTAEESDAFGASVGRWPAFPDSVDALRRLAKRFKLVILSNVDRASFSRTNEGPLEGLPFDLIITAQDVGSYKPDPRNFDYMLREVQDKFGVGKEGVLQTAQSQFHDHHPAKKVGIRSCWIVRPGAIMGNREDEIYDFKFDTLGELADAVEREG